MSLTAYCAKCNKLGHWAGECPEVTNTVTNKKAWVKPKLTRWVKADSLTESNKSLTGVMLESNKFDKKAYQREYMRKRREANRVG